MMVGKVIFILFVTSIIIKVIITYRNNEKLPVLTTKARLIIKTRDIHTDVHVNGAITSNTDLILVFELDTGSKIKFKVRERIFSGVPEYEWGKLDYKGERFLKFRSASGCIEKL
ncbi:DUF2500 domain-containing protein [Clostridium folliculivorans]|uniref:DUF2500 domain-containing protein n=1 Tax=Clostridium folliculivorans TaxID=2886038 RepID=A0A9W5Y4Q0_9CLOT|nr:DUF2500 domain-containing protein [Clostridium folliculivorans]GKU26480.1 hypothetical protein CFOLD11_33070 [Clostridium folliculivorans]GKU29088.1 hypothetical protein CFB3_11940 [Clostridium folliculivorans]